MQSLQLTEVFESRTMFLYLFDRMQSQQGNMILRKDEFVKSSDAGYFCNAICNLVQHTIDENRTSAEQKQRLQLLKEGNEMVDWIEYSDMAYKFLKEKHLI